MKSKRNLRIMSLLLVSILIFSCIGCSDNKKPDNDVTSSNIETSDENVSSSNPSSEIEDENISSSNSSLDIEDENVSTSYSSSEIDEENNSSSLDFETNDEKFENMSSADTKVDDGSPNSSKYNNSKRINFSDYIIIYDDEISEDAVRDARSLARAIYKITGKYPKVNSDKEVTVNSATKKEIIIGNTDRNESEKSLSAIKENRTNCFYDYIIKVYDNRIVINSITEEKIGDAIEFFIETFLSINETVIPENYDFICYENVSTCMSIGGVDVSNFVILCGSTPARITYKGCEELQKAIEEKTDYIVPIVKEETYVGNKILIKITNKNFYDYEIAVKDKNIVITAGHSYSANAALHALASNIKVVKKGYKFNIPNNYISMGKYSDKTINTDNYSLVFSDEFNGNAVNTKNFNIDGLHLSDILNLKKSPVVPPDGIDIMTNFKSNAVVNDGCLNLKVTSKQSEVGKMLLLSEVKSNFEYQFGLIEIRAKIPKGHGFWPAFWMASSRTLEQPYSIEIDMFEFFGNDTRCASQIHSWWTPGRTVPGLYATEAQITAGHIQHLGSDDSKYYELPGNKSFADEFHTFAVEWTPKFIEFSVDGEAYFTQSLTASLIHPEYGYLINEYMAALNRTTTLILSANGSRGTFDENSIVPNVFQIDYVHIYQQNGVGSFKWK